VRRSADAEGTYSRDFSERVTRRCHIFGWSDLIAISSQSTQSPSANNAADKNNKRLPNEGLWHWLTHDAAGFFTLWHMLWISCFIGFPV
jgi:hypothetical protein